MSSSTNEKLPPPSVLLYKAKKVAKIKIKKQDKLSLDLEKNVDILDYFSNHNSLRPKLVVGFAAETSNLIENSKTPNKFEVSEMPHAG